MKMELCVVVFPKTHSSIIRVSTFFLCLDKIGLFDVFVIHYPNRGCVLQFNRGEPKNVLRSRVFEIKINSMSLGIGFWIRYQTTSILIAHIPPWFALGYWYGSKLLYPKMTTSLLGDWQVNLLLILTRFISDVGSLKERGPNSILKPADSMDDIDVLISNHPISEHPIGFSKTLVPSTCHHLPSSVSNCLQFPCPSPHSCLFLTNFGISSFLVQIDHVVATIKRQNWLCQQ